MANMTKFQLALMIAFGAIIIIGVFVFANYKGTSEKIQQVTMWGTFPESVFSTISEASGLSENKQYRVNYVQKSEKNFDNDFIEALASQNGPDIFLLPSEKIVTHRNKIFPIPYSVFSARQFKDSFVEGAEIYMLPDGIAGLPIYSDPLVMYWNRDLFTEANLTKPPAFWDEFYDLAKTLSKKDGSLNINQSFVSFGEYSNVSNAKEIILNLALQAGTPVYIWNQDKLQNVFATNFGKSINPGEAAVNFYTEFSNPSKDTYSWNRSLPNSTDLFLSGDLALYFGFASEISSLQLKNPNLNFDVSSMPKTRDGSDVSFANYYALSITKSSKNPNAAFGVISILANKNSSSKISSIMNLPPARRDLLSSREQDEYRSVFNTSVIRSRGWLDPKPVSSDQVFKTMIDSITSGRSRSGEAVYKAERELNNLIEKQ